MKYVTVVRFGALLLGAAGFSAAASADVVSTFDLNNDGWVVSDGGPTIPAPWLPIGGNPTGHITYTDVTTPLPNSYFFAPSKFGGNQISATRLQFDLTRSAVTPIPPGVDLVIDSAYGFLARTLVPAPGAGLPWTSYDLSLTDPTDWRMESNRPANDMDMRAVMRSLKKPAPNGWPIHIRSGWSTSPGETGSLDNVRLVGGAVGGAAILPGVFNVDVLNVSGVAARGLKIVMPGDAVLLPYQGGQLFPGAGTGPNAAIFAQRDVLNGDPAPVPGVEPGRKTLWWHGIVSPDANSNGVIDPGQIFHPGFQLDRGSLIEDMYWTDDNGNAVANGHIHVSGTDLVYNSVTGETKLDLTNTLSDIYGDDTSAALTISHRFMMQTMVPFDLADLNRDNAALNAGLLPIGGGPLSLAPGDSENLLLGTFAPGTTLVFRYEVTSPTSGGNVMVFAQFTLPVPEPVGASLCMTAALLLAALRWRR